MAEKQSKRQTTEQKRAAAAWVAVSEVQVADQSKYSTWVRKLPALIQSNGLGSAMAFLCVKCPLLYGHVSRWVTAHLKYSGDDLLDLIRNSSAEQYRRATAEAIAYAGWLKRYVEGQGWKEEEE